MIARNEHPAVPLLRRAHPQLRSRARQPVPAVLAPADGGRPLAAAVRKLLQELLRALQNLHRLSPPILHRDIQAKTVLFREAADWGPVLVDFVPRSAGAATATSDLSAVARVVELAAGGGLGT